MALGLACTVFVAKAEVAEPESLVRQSLQRGYWILPPGDRLPPPARASARRAGGPAPPAVSGTPRAGPCRTCVRGPPHGLLRGGRFSRRARARGSSRALRPALARNRPAHRVA